MICEIIISTSRTNVVEHIKHIYEEGELDENSTCRKFRQVRKEGNREVAREIFLAKSAGMKTIWIKQGFGVMQEPLSEMYEPDEVIHKLEELLLIL